MKKITGFEVARTRSKSQIFARIQSFFDKTLEVLKAYEEKTSQYASRDPKEYHGIVSNHKVDELFYENHKGLALSYRFLLI